MDIEKDAQIIAHMRRDGRTALTAISKKTGLPVSTIFDRIKGCSAITRYSALLDFREIGFGCRAIVLLRTTKDKKRELGQHLLHHPYVNSLHKINNGMDYLLEGVFKDLGHIEQFIEDIEERYTLRTKEVHYLLEEMKREGFMTDPASARAVAQGRMG
ncbi:MAG: Lrp/AsnC family transcriptional regulator [Nanoarchaeota archaeon]